MTDLTPYMRIVQRAERLATSGDADATDTEFEAMLAELTALGPPEDPRARAALWTRFDAARRASHSARDAPEPTAPPARPRRANMLGAAFVGYLRLFSFRTPDARTRFWPFALIGVPVGAILLIGVGSWVSTGPLFAVLFFPLLFGALVIVFALATAVRRRLLDAGADPWLFLVVPYAPVAFGLDLGLVPIIYSPTAEIRNSAGMSLAAVAIGVLFVANAAVHVALACAQPTGRARTGGAAAGLVIVSMFVPVLVPLLLVLALLLLVLASLGVDRRTTRVAGSRRRVGGRRAAGGRWRRGYTTTVREHSRRLSGYTQTSASQLLGAAGGSLVLAALAVIATPFLIWRRS